MTEQQFKICSRLAKTQDGIDFINEILEPMAKDNYKDLLNGGKEFRDEVVGFGNCLATLLDLLNNSDIRLTEQNTPVPDEARDWA